MLFYYRKLRFLIILIFLLAMVLFMIIKIPFSHRVSIETLQEKPTSANDAAQVVIRSTFDYLTAPSLTDLTVRSKMIVMGHVERVDRAINTARDMNDITKADRRFLHLGQFYQIKIDTVLKGKDSEASAIFVQPEGYLPKEQQSEEPLPEDIELARKNFGYYPFVDGHRYLLFLYSVDGLDYFVPLGLEPWRFDITDENNAFPESPAHVNVHPAPLIVIIKEIEAALTPTPESTVLSPLSTPQPMNTFPPALP